jgi:hypothetical protein
MKRESLRARTRRALGGAWLLLARRGVAGAAVAPAGRPAIGRNPGAPTLITIPCYTRTPFSPGGKVLE